MRGATKKTQNHKINKSKNLSEGLCEKNPELASHRMKYICVALQVPKNAPSQSPIELRNRTDIFSDISSTPLHKASQSDGINFLQRNHDGEGRTLA